MIHFLDNLDAEGFWRCRTVKEEDIDISFEAAVAFLFPRVWENVRSALTQEYINGYNDAKKEMEDAD